VAKQESSAVPGSKKYTSTNLVQYKFGAFISGGVQKGRKTTKTDTRRKKGRH